MIFQDNGIFCGLSPDKIWEIPHMAYEVFQNINFDSTGNPVAAVQDYFSYSTL